MKKKKDFIVEIEDNQEELISKKEKKQTGFGKYCIFAGTLVLFGTVAGISINKHNTYDNNDTSIESTSITDSLDNISNVNSENKQPVIVKLKPIYEEQVICYEDENGITCAENCQVIVGYEPIYADVNDLYDAKKTIPVMLQLKETKRKVVYEIDQNGNEIATFKEITECAKKAILIPQSDKEVIAIQAINPEIIYNDNGNQLSFIMIVPIYDGESMPASSTLFVKTDYTDENGLPLYEHCNIYDHRQENEHSSKTK